jgi:hypothetical protein
LTQDITALEGIEIGGTLSFFIRMEGMEALYGLVKEKVSILQEMHRRFYGTLEFTMRDPDGYLLAFAEKVE